MNSTYFRISCLVLAIFVIQVSCKSLAEETEVQPPKEIEVAVPEAAAPVKETVVETPTQAPQPQTTRRPGIVLGIWNGIVRAPAEIANRVQGILVGINNRRRNATTAAPKVPASPPTAKVFDLVKLAE